MGGFLDFLTGFFKVLTDAAHRVGAGGQCQSYGNEGENGEKSTDHKGSPEFVRCVQCSNG